MAEDEINVGDRVRAVDEAVEGIVTHMNANEVMVEIDGMDMPFTLRDLVKVEHDDLIKGHQDDQQLSAKDKAQRKRGREKLGDLGQSDQATYELDLHIDELLDHHRPMSNGEILSYQMQCCRAFVREALDKRYQKIVIIHGVGEGVLKQEVHRYLDQMDHLSYHDAPYRIYGYGATEVMIHR